MGFSAGKDSVTIEELARMAKVKYDAHYHLCPDPAEVIKFLKNNYPSVQIHKPDITMWKLIPQKLMPPTRTARYCCEVFKEHGGEGRRVITGVRWAESNKRKSNRKMIEYWKNHKFVINPIIDWTDDDVWEFIKYRRKLEYCSLYDEGFKRIGCVMCPNASKRARLMEMERFPTYYKMYLLAFEKMLEERKVRKLETDRWESPEDVMNWWIYCPENNKNKSQCTIFE